MAGKPLRRRRQEALERLDLETKQKLATVALSRINDSALIGYAAAHLRSRPSDRLDRMDDARSIVRAAITNDESLLGPLILSCPALLDQHLTT